MGWFVLGGVLMLALVFWALDAVMDRLAALEHAQAYSNALLQQLTEAERARIDGANTLVEAARRLGMDSQA